MRYLKTYNKIFESKNIMDDFYKRADDVRKKFSSDMDDLDSEYNKILDDCMHDLMDNIEWSPEKSWSGTYMTQYTFKIKESDIKRFHLEMCNCLGLLNSVLGIKYSIKYFCYNSTWIYIANEKTDISFEKLSNITKRHLYDGNAHIRINVGGEEDMEDII